MIDGDTSASPTAAARTASTRSAAPASFRRKPLAPFAIAVRTYSSRSNVVTTTTEIGSVTSGPASRRVAARPSSSGIRMSSRHTSGRSRWASSTASTSVGRLADDLDAVGLEDEAEARAHHRLVVRDHDAERLGHVPCLRGSRASMRQPPPSTGPAWKRPPSASVRSAMPMRP